MFTPEQRDTVRARILALAQGDPRVTGGALTGSTASGAGDRWSDVDIAFGVAAGVRPGAVLDDWTGWLEGELGALHYWDLPADAWIYRVFLLPSGLEVDLAVAPEAEFGARGPNFRPVFGTARPLQATPPPTARDLIGLGWHHVLHSRVSIERDQPWRAEYWISAVRDKTLALACLRLGESAVEARGIDRLPAAATAPLGEALVRSLEPAELRRALAAATAGFMRELAAADPELSARLAPILREFGRPAA